MSSFIGPDQPVLIVGALLATVAAGMWLERRPWSRGVPGAVYIILLAAILANLGVTPAESPASNAVKAVAPPIGIALMLLRANIRQIVNHAGRLLSYYGIGCITGLVGVTVGLLVVPLGAFAPQLAALKVASLVGGSANILAVGQSLAIPDAAFAIFFSAGSIVTSAYVAAAGLLAGNRWVAMRFARNQAAATRTARVTPPAAAAAPASRFEAIHAPLLLAYAVLTYGICDLVMRQLGFAQYTVIAVSVVAILIANLAPRSVARLAGDREMGLTAMFMLFAVIGSSVDLRDLGGPALAMALFVLITVTVHLALLLAIGYLLRAPLVDLVIASVAGVGGPSTAAALAASHDSALVTPAILAGLLGFVIGTFVALLYFPLAQIMA